MAALVGLLALTAAPVAAAAPEVSLTASPSTVRVNGTVSLSATATPGKDTTITSVAWDFGDGTSAADGLSQSHAYASAGAKTVTFTAVDSKGKPKAATADVAVVGDPAASFKSSPAAPNAGEAVHFDATASRDPAGAIHSYAWDFGDGSQGTGAHPTHAYAAGGDKAVTLTITSDVDGRTATDSHTVHVNVPPHVVALHAAIVWAALIDPPTQQDPSTPLIGQRVAFSAQTSGDTDGALRFAWDPGSGTFSKPSSANRLVTTFPAAGTRTVRVRVTGGGGADDVAVATFRVNTLPVASFTFAPVTPRPNARVTFTSTTTDADGDLAGQQWDLNGDGQFDDATGATAQAIYLRPGDYTVGIKATDSGRASATAYRTVSVAGPAMAPDAGTPSGGMAAPTIIPAPGSAPVKAGDSTGSGAPPASGKATPRLRVVPGVRVQIAGTVRAALTRITQLLVVAPRGALVVARCRGGGCPAKAVRRTVGSRGRLRLHRLERSLRAGAVITVTVAKRGYVTKRIQLRMRRSSAPKRRQTCVVPGARKTTPCPAP